MKKSFREIFSSFRKNKGIVTVFSIDNYLSIPEDNSDTIIAKMHEGYSRFVFNINKNRGETFVTANIPYADVSPLKYKLSALHTMCMMSSSNDKYTEEEMRILGVYIPIRGFKIIDLLRKGSNDIKITIKMLNDNISTYPNNRKIIEDIIKGLEIKKEKGLEDTNCFKSLYSQPFKFVERKNFKLVYGIEITYDSSHKYPVNIHITNAKQDLKEKIGSEKTMQGTSKNLDFKFSLEEFTEMVDKMYRIINHFEKTYYPGIHKFMVDNSYGGVNYRE